MKYIFIDLGAYDGDSIRMFMRKRKLPVSPSRFEIYAFEPNPIFWNDLNSLPFDNIVQIDTAAAWTNDGIRKFALDTNDLAYGSTLMESKKAIWDNFDKVEVHTFDFSGWIKQFENDHVIVKMDIEGSEFLILEKMLREGTAKIMNQLWIELHPNKVEGYTSEYSNKLVERLKKAGVWVELWH